MCRTEIWFCKYVFSFTTGVERWWHLSKYFWIRNDLFRIRTYKSFQVIPALTQGQEKNDRFYGKGNVIGLRDFLKLLWKQKAYVQLGIWPLLKYKIPKTVHLRRKTIIPGLIRPGSKVKYAVTFSYTKLKLVWQVPKGMNSQAYWCIST